MAENPTASGAAAAAGGASRGLAATALVTGALVWGLIWYPYRILRDAGIGGIPSTTLTYAIAFALALLIWRPWPTRPAHPWLMVGLALAAGGCNLGYVMATISGEVMRVLLLFYLAPLWTVLLAWTVLGERLNRFGAFVVFLSLAGAATMLWRPESGLPLPRDLADWYGLGAGFCFALFNVLSRRARDLPVSQRILVSFLGVVALGALLGGIDLPAAVAAPSSAWWLLLLTGALLLVINLVVQYGLAHTPANQAIVIMLSEVGFAAVSSWLLAGELLGLQEWVGGAMIIAASLFTTKMEK
ncbi:MAG: DMT family transporter [Rhodocyclales bacterium]|nr:DMT family transporter [Rhodocyclales bacterium]